jgi:ComF family protein
VPPISCTQCGRFLFGEIHILKCGYCLTHPPLFDVTHALFPYEWPVSSFIVKLKFQHQIYYAKILGELMAMKIRTTWYTDTRLPDCIIPIPLHPQRLAERGFNQALEIAKPIAKILSIPLHKQGIKRVKPTKAQSGLRAKERSQNMANAFAATRDYKGLKVAILDDVITTGQTVMECSRILKKLGTRQIDIWCCARR